MKSMAIAVLVAVLLAGWTINYANTEYLEVDTNGADRAVVEYAVVDDYADCYSPSLGFQYLNSGEPISGTFRYKWSAPPTAGQYACVRFTSQSGYERLLFKTIAQMRYTYMPAVTRVY